MPVEIQVIAIDNSARFITVDHGKLTVKVPFDLFYGTEGDIDVTKRSIFGETLRARYPWITENSLNVILKKAKREYVHTIDNESNGRIVAKELAAKGRKEDAVSHLKKHLENNPEDADSWYTLGDILCSMGNAEEGYKAYARGRELF